MIEGNATTQTSKELDGGMKRYVRRVLSKLGFRIMQDAKQSVQKASGPSIAGSPPHTHDNSFKASIAYAVEGDSVVVGMRQSVIGKVGEVMEFGGSYKGQQYPARPTIGPAAKRQLDEAANAFAGAAEQSFGE